MIFGGTLHEWYRFLDVHSDEEAVCELRRHQGRLEGVYDELEKSSRRLSCCPDADVEDALRVARLSLSEAVEMLGGVVSRFRAGEHEIA